MSKQLSVCKNRKKSILLDSIIAYNLFIRLKGEMCHHIDCPYETATSGYTTATSIPDYCVINPTINSCPSNAVYVSQI